MFFGAIIVVLSLFAFGYTLIIYSNVRDKSNRTRQQPRAKMDYELALKVLATNPQNTSLKLDALSKGRIYYSLLRKYRRLTTHDENAINNDLIVRGVNK